ncbi:hypothetical protein C0Q70_03404 [Pomacea canaliculata]|uniref:Tyrosine-protein kinase n=1 Tax=Pomacea canaliculata TaxID=400727 RepID=A0A2T7PSL7_POMCA|nr:hypothetical protein C0Q70_03404 [Pomacea canaliculata]
MGFGTDLQGRSSHEALLKVQDAEIRLLETLKRFITSRIEADRQYTASLTKMVYNAAKSDSNDLLEFQDCCSVFRAWDTILKETDIFIKQIREHSDVLHSRTLDSLNFLIAEKKSARRNYLDLRNALDTEMSKRQEDVQKNKLEYGRLLDRLKLDKAKFQDAQTKGKGGSKVDDAKSRLIRTMSRLHNQHNDYILAVAEANNYQSIHCQQLLPAVLDCHQAIQELFIRQLKFVLTDYANMTDFTSRPFQDVALHISTDVERIQPGSEYGSTFISKFRSDPLTPIKFDFDHNFMDEYSGKLKPSELVLDDLTFENFQHRHTRYTHELKQEQKALELHEAELQDAAHAVMLSEQRMIEESSSERMKELIEKHKQQELEKKEVAERKAHISRLKDLIKLTEASITALGDSNPPPAFEGNDIADGETESNFSTSSRDKDKKFKFPSVHIFKRGDKSNGRQRPNCDDLDDDDTEVRPRAGDAIPTQKRRIEDEEWFHGVLPREEVQRLLTEDGDYLVRESKNRKTNETQYVLSVFWQGHKHFIIQGSEETGWRFEGASYPTIQELIQKQHASGQPVTNKSQAILQKAIVREDWELLNDHIHLEMKIGNGNFGEVYKGKYVPKNMVVAVKTCRDTLSEDQRKKFLLEGRILKQYNHPNIVKFIGIAAQRQPVMIVMEFVPGGALLTFLRKQGRLQSRRQLTQMCVDAANGMSYLENRGCIHRDLAARNCLVGDNSVIKISDFGMSREEEEYTVSEGMKQIPIKWTAPEALNYGKYTSLCDVWSYGILMWEIFSAGQQPYTGWTNAQAREKIDGGYRLPQPTDMPDSVYQIMKRCWEYQPERRPHFKEIYESLSDAVKRV